MQQCRYLLLRAPLPSPFYLLTLPFSFLNKLLAGVCVITLNVASWPLWHCLA